MVKRGGKFLESSRYKFFRTAGKVAAYAAAGDVGAFAYDQLVPMPKGNPPSYGQGTFTKEKGRGGRRLSRKTNKWTKKITRASASKLVFGLQDTTEAFGSYGYYSLLNYYDSRPLTDAGQGGYYLPIHLWDLTSVPNTSINTDVITNGQCGYRIGVSSPLTPQVPRHRTVGSPMSIINAPTTIAQGAVRNTSLLRAAKIRIMCYCPPSRPTRFKIMLVQINDPNFHPSKNGESPFNPIDGRLDQGNAVPDNNLLPNDQGTALYAAANFWIDQAQTFTTNPANITGINNNNKALKVLKSQTFILNPKETVDPAGTTYHMVDWYHQFNRVCTYNWESTNQTQIAALPPFDAPERTSVGQARNCVHPRARIYLMICADLKYFGSDAAPPTPENARDNAPTYDISLRTYHDDIV